jgi:hypothetical protein
MGMPPSMIGVAAGVGGAPAAAAGGGEAAVPGGRAQPGDGTVTVIKNGFLKGPEGWCSYDYHTSVISKSEIFVLTTRAREGGVDNSPYIHTDHFRWSADTPENPISILALIFYFGWVNMDPMDLRGAEVSVYLRGDDLKLSGAKCYFWVNSPGVRWHLMSRPLTVTEGHWAKEPNRFTLVNDEALWHNTWSSIPPRFQSLDSMLRRAHSYGFSFIGYTGEVTGKLSMDEFELRTKR